MLFLDATPILTELMKLTVGRNVKEQMESDLKLEVEAVALYNRAIHIAREEDDNASGELFERLLKDEEAHVDWPEAQMHQMAEIGYEWYLSQQNPGKKQRRQRPAATSFAIAATAARRYLLAEVQPPAGAVSVVVSRKG